MDKWKGVEYSITCEPVLTEVTLATVLESAHRIVTRGWENDPILSRYCQPKPKPNKYQRRYARIGRRRKK